MNRNGEIPFMNVRDLVIFPQMQISLVIGRPFSMDAIKYAVRENKSRILIVTQRAAENERPSRKSDMFSVGVACRILQSVAFPDKSMKVRIEGLHIAKVTKIFEKDGIRFASYKTMQHSLKPELNEKTRQEVIELLVQWNPRIAIDSEEPVVQDLCNEKNPDRFTGKVLRLMSSPMSLMGRRKAPPKNVTAASTKALNSGVFKRQKLLEISDCKKRLQAIKKILREETLISLAARS